ncbi:MAG: hypothetical protein ABI778_03710 [Ignavibacteriota bacterium]
MKSAISFLLLIVFLFCNTHSANAQIPRAISFQGVLASANGVFVPDGNYHLTLNLYSAAIGGTSLYSETHTAVVVKGIFNVIIGSATPIPLSLTFDRAYFLGVTISGGTELTPRTALAAVPYALNAEHATLADNISPTAKGVVTSINEEDGALHFVGTGGTTISNSGRIFTISSATGGSGSGFKLPYSDSAVNGMNPIFNVGNRGTTGTTISGIGNRGSQLPQMTSAAVLGDGGTGYNGVVGYSDGGSNAFAGVLAQSSGNANGINVVSNRGDGVNAVSSNGRAGFFQSTSGSSNTLEAINKGSGIGVKGISSANTGVFGETSSLVAPGIRAQYSGAGVGTALELANGALKVSGVNQTAFVHTATVANLRQVPSPHSWGKNATEIDNPLCNGDPNAMVLITNYQGTVNQSGGLQLALTSGVAYDTLRQKWQITIVQTEVMEPGTQFFVLIIKK